jgi:nitrite reductase/ring-hydroxylating ferredoxin subunit
VQTFVSDDGSVVNPRIFTDPSIFEVEQERIFGRCWLFIGHESELPEPGSFIRTTIGAEPVLVTRDRDGQIHAHLNVCRHRGTELCRVDSGTATTFQCSYHGWTYRNDGRLVGVPGKKTIYFDDIDTDEWGLKPVAKLDTYKGLIFGTFDRDAPTLLDYLGNMAWYLDVLLDRRHGGTELIGVQRWTIPTNWKVVAENHGGDEYHVGFAHRSNFPPDVADPARIVPLAREIRPEIGHGLGAYIFPEDQSFRTQGGPLAPPPLARYLADIEDEVVERLGELRSRIGWVHGCVFPNFAMVPVFNSIRMIHPRGPDHVQMASYVLVDRDAPVEVKAIAKATAMQTFGPAGSFEQDDGGNWSDVTRCSKGPQARSQRYHLGMGLGHEEHVDGLPGEVGATASEMNQRGFYRRWADMMGEQ